MKKKLRCGLILILAVLIYFMVFCVMADETKNFIRVELYSGKCIKVTSDSIFLIYDGNSGDLLEDSQNFINFYYAEDGIKIDEERVLPHILRLVPQDAFLCFSGNSYRGEFWIINQGEKISLVNQLGIEEYLFSVVGSEVPAYWPLEALKSQAVAARTYAYYKILNGKNMPFDVSDEVKDQVYLGIRGESASTRKAVEATSGVVMTYEGSIIKAYYHSCCGGQTEDGENVFEESGSYLKGQKCAFCVNSSSQGWSLALDDFFLKKRLGIPEDKVIEEISLRKSSSGRVKEVIIDFDGVRLKFSSAKFRQLLGYNLLKSTFLDVKLVKTGNVVDEFAVFENKSILSGYKLQKYTKSQIYLLCSDSVLRLRNVDELGCIKDKYLAYVLPRHFENRSGDERIYVSKVRIYGRGWGHGVGMCQWGASGMGERGYNYRDILKYYYTGIEFKKVNPASGEIEDL